MDGIIWVVGVGPGDPRWLTLAALQIIETSDLLVGGARNLEAFQYLNKATLLIGNNLEAVCQTIAADGRSRKIAVLASGDPGLFSIFQTLQRKLPGMAIEAVPGISAVQYLCNRVGIPWDQLRIVSLHGRESLDLAAEIRQHRRVCAFTDARHTPQAICGALLSDGYSRLRVTVGANLSYPEERIITGYPAEILRYEFGSLCLMLLEMEGSLGERWPYRTPGIPDSYFIRDSVPMTKEEVRGVTLAKLRLAQGNTVFDIGAGTGSVSVECALLNPGGKVYAIEHNPSALKLLAANREQFGVLNLTIVPGTAPAVLAKLTPPDRVFIGGAAGNLKEIIEWLSGLTTNPRIVLNAIALETTYQALQWFKAYGFTATELIQLSVSRSEVHGGKHLLKALNPIYLISAEKEAST